MRCRKSSKSRMLASVRAKARVRKTGSIRLHWRNPRRMRALTWKPGNWCCSVASVGHAESSLPSKAGGRGGMMGSVVRIESVLADSAFGHCHKLPLLALVPFRSVRLPGAPGAVADWQNWHFCTETSFVLADRSQNQVAFWIGSFLRLPPALCVTPHQHPCWLGKALPAANPQLDIITARPAGSRLHRLPGVPARRDCVLPRRHRFGRHGFQQPETQGHDKGPASAHLISRYVDPQPT